MESRDIGLFKLKSIRLPDNAYNSFFYLNKLDLPDKGISGGGDIVALKIRFGKDLNRQYYTSLGPFVAQVPRGYIGASPIVSQRLRMKELDEVLVSLCRSNSLSVVYVRPKCNDDYNILANMQNVMENVMLYQVRIVAAHQLLPVKIGNIIVDLIVDNIKPGGECGSLEKFTEVIIMDVLDQTSSENTIATISVPPTTSIIDLVWNFFRRGTQFWEETKVDPDDIDCKRQENICTEDIIISAFRNKKVIDWDYRVIPETNPKSEVIVTNYGFKTDAATPCVIQKIVERTVLSPSASETNKKQEQEIHCLVISRHSLPENVREIYLPTSIMKTMGLHLGSRVFVRSVSSLPKNHSLSPKTIEADLDDNKKIDYQWDSILDIKNKVSKTIDCSLKNGLNSNILITGPSGCGKSFLLKLIAKSCADQNWFNLVLSCKPLRGKKIESLLKILTSKWSECAYREPSVLILDDIDSLCLSDEEVAETGMSNVYCKRLANIFTELSESFSKTSRIVLVATSLSVQSLRSALASSRGPRLFSVVLKVPEMTETERGIMLEFLGTKVKQELVAKTHGYRIQDLVDVVSRAKLHAVIAGRLEVTESDVEASVEDTVPLALQGVHLQADVPYKWTDVGGMDNVKTVLDEIFRWPSQFPDVFASSPLRLQTGALLYGPPGCGKTLIAGAIANECGMNFKSVKGPELLSKFVGASEAAVRNLFERAQQARPCLLFFDELDSLAPRRGADSTGVTDRVVNQLLTELDGVEGRDGVWILGASSRPDLIDPALLRPGRLDRTIYCAVPTIEERLRILEVLSRSLLLADDVSLDYIASKTDNFSGADLQALLYNSQMKAIQDNPENMDNPNQHVTAKHFEAALHETKSSLSKADMQKYEIIFKRFQAAKDSKKTPLLENQSQRVTFA